MGKAFTAAVVLTVGCVALWLPVEVLDAWLGGSIARLHEECGNSAGSCKWRTLFMQSSDVELNPRAAVDRWLHGFAELGLFVYPASLLAFALFLWNANDNARRRWSSLAGALVAALVLMRFVMLGVFTALTY